MNEIISQVTESITNPASAVPAVGIVQAANWLGWIPEGINILTIIYLSLLVLHKGYVLYMEWKQKKIFRETE